MKSFVLSKIIQTQLALTSNAKEQSQLLKLTKKQLSSIDFFWVRSWPKHLLLRTYVLFQLNGSLQVFRTYLQSFQFLWPMIFLSHAKNKLSILHLRPRKKINSNLRYNLKLKIPRGTPFNKMLKLSKSMLKPLRFLQLSLLVESTLLALVKTKDKF